MFKAIAVAGLSTFAMLAQETKESPLKIGEEICITANNTGASAHMVLGTRPLNDAPPFLKIPRDQRPDVSDFGVCDEGGKLSLIRDHKGKILVITFWTYSCEGSLRQLKELEYFQGEEKRGDFLVWPTHNEGWGPVMSFIRRKKAAFGEIRIFKAGIAEHGMHVLGNPITALPMTYVIDRKGRLAASYSGYRVGRLAALLNEYYNEK
ncbi:MAG TPA: TlpA disulfide reductase family protein [Holophagaceae bacterium]|nr:TlpA disulfide reductase family protein [Holophagaceae bacterium]